MFRLLRIPSLLLLASVALSCGSPPAVKPAGKTDAAPPPSAQPLASAAEPAITALKTGALVPIVVPAPIAGHLVDRCVVEGAEYLRVDLGAEWLKPIQAREAKPGTDSFWQGDFAAPIEVSAVSIAGSPAALGFVLLNDNDDATLRQMQSSVGPPPPRDTLWLRREAAQAGAALDATLYLAAFEARPGYEFKVQVPPSAGPTGCNKLDLFARALRRHFERQPQNAFHAFASERLGGTFPVARVQPNRELSSRPPLELSELMGLATGYQSVEAALQRQNNLRTAVEPKSQNIPLAKLTKPNLVHHPWVQMLASLRTPPAVEPLAQATPAEFYWVRARSVGALYKLLDEVESWLTPAYHVLHGNTAHRLIRQRYETEIALQSNELGPVAHLVEEVALVGSDPFVVMGSDMTLILRINSPELLKKAALDLALAAFEKVHGKTQESRFSHEGIVITLVQSPDHAIRRYSAEVNGLTLISNSKGGISRVVSAVLGKVPNLANEPDFRYMLARDGLVLDDVLLYLGDRFIERAVSPASRIVDARRMFAQSELLRPAHAALLHGWLKGAAPKNAAALEKAKLLHKGELKHFDTQPIQFDIGKAPRSSWGTPRAMTPLIDLPAPAKVSAIERDAYQRFVSQYESLWSEAVDPVALRIRLQEKNGKPMISANLRVLPVVQNSDYRSLQELVGDVRLLPGERAEGLRVLFSLAQNSALKRELGSSSRGLLGQELNINWIGNFALLGLADTPAVANALARTRGVPSPPLEVEMKEQDDFSRLAQLPLYAAIEVGSVSATAIALAVVRKELEGGSIQWQPPTDFDGTQIHQVRLSDLPGTSLFYALGRKVLFVSLSRPVLEGLLSAEKAGRGPSAARGSSPGEGQFVFDLAAKPDGGLLVSLGWLLEHELRRGATNTRSRAELVFRADPKALNDPDYFQNLALNYFGAIPVTPDGALYQFTERGVTDAARGSAHAPVWPKVPVAGSDAARVLAGFAGLRTQLAFDREPSPDPNTPLTSLAVSIELERRNTAPSP